MRSTLFFLVVSLGFLLGCSKDQSDEIARLTQENANLKALAGPPPASLDSLYPPKAPAPILQIKMLDMSAPFTGIVIKIMEGDRQGARALFDSFKAKYTAVSGLVPEWKNDFPSDPLYDLEVLIEKGEPGEIMGAVERVGKVCHDCHIVNMPKVQQKYHWQDFSMITLTDPATKRDLDFTQLMLSLDMSFTGIGMEMQQGKVEKARKHFEDLSRSFGLMKEVCQTCHESERQYYVSADINALLSKLGKTLKSPSPDMKLVGEISQQLGTESCTKCHLVHVPAAFAKARWDKGEHSSQ